MDKVLINDLRFKTIVGCWDWERQVPQEVSIDLAVGWDITEAVATDDLQHALDYKELARHVEECVQQGRFLLVETAAAAVAAMVIDQYAAPWVRVTFRKPFAVTGSAAVGVIVERSAGQGADAG